MNCEQFSSQLDAYHDGELDAARVAEMDAHLRECPACALALQSLRSMSHLMQTIPMTEMSADAVSRLHAAVDRTMDRSLLPLARSFVGIAASILVVATAGLFWMQPSHASAPQAWEGAMLVSQQSNDLSQTANSGTMEPDLIVADLSRSNRP
ncbi:MAG: zf-HC2 domain-containing protein [Anaerolineae bacterium]|nr:zf-HC2 domain-containing protein [Phycisphaerae bacterium]